MPAILTSPNSPDPDQDQQNVSPDQDLYRFTPLIVFLKDFCKKNIFENKFTKQQKHDKSPRMQRATVLPAKSDSDITLCL